MTALLAMLSGKKTYLVAAAVVAYQLFGHYYYGQPFDVNALLGALGLTALRAGVAKSGPLVPVLVLGLALSGCAGGGIGSNQADFIKALAMDPASNCVVASSPYGGLLVARGTPGAKVNLAGGTCSIEASPAPVPAK
jgi:hypothetical protein